MLKRSEGRLDASEEERDGGEVKDAEDAEEMRGG